MRGVLASYLLGAALFAAAPAAAQSSGGPLSGGAPQAGPANLCQELLAFAEKAAAEARGSSGETKETTTLVPRQDGEGAGRQGGGSVSTSSSNDTSEQADAPTTSPAAPAAAPEAASSPHANDGGRGPAESTAQLAQIREAVERGDRMACRATVQELRRSGAEMPAALLALAAYEPDASRR